MGLQFIRILSRSAWPSLVWTFLILLACSLPGKEIPEAPLFPHFDKLVHFGLFFVWSILWLARYPSRWLVILVSGIIFGIFIEFYQEWLPIGRSFDWWDAVADSFGAVTGTIIFLALTRKG
jgi:VanZ family protein